MEDIKVLSEKLNSEIEKNGLKGNISILIQNAIDGICQSFNAFAPLSKVAIFYCKDTYDEYNIALTKKLKELGINPVNIILPNKKNISLTLLSKLFTLSEDIRGVACLDSNLFFAISYFATIRNIPAVYCVRDENLTEAFNSSSFVMNGDILDKIYFNNVRYVVIDCGKLQKDNKQSDLFADIMQKSVALMDYRISTIVDRSFIPAYYNLARRGIITSYQIFNSDREEQIHQLIYSAVLIGVANILSGGIILSRSAICMANLFFNLNGYEKLFLLKSVISLFSMDFGGEYNHILDIADYNERARVLSKFTSINESYFLSNFQQQVFALNVYKQQFNGKKEILKEEVKNLSLAVDKIIKIYRALGGKEKEETNAIKSIVKYSGDIFPYVNGLSICREDGILEYL